MAEIRSNPAVWATSQNKIESNAADGQPKNKNGNPMQAKTPSVSRLAFLAVRNRDLSIISSFPARFRARKEYTTQILTYS